MCPAGFLPTSFLLCLSVDVLCIVQCCIYTVHTSTTVIARVICDIIKPKSRLILSKNWVVFCSESGIRSYVLYTIFFYTGTLLNVVYQERVLAVRYCSVGVVLQ